MDPEIETLGYRLSRYIIFGGENGHFQSLREIFQGERVSSPEMGNALF
jgi:hypothetical protein